MDGGTPADPLPPRSDGGPPARAPRPASHWFVVVFGVALVMTAVIVVATRLGGDDDPPPAHATTRAGGNRPAASSGPIVPDGRPSGGTALVGTADATKPAGATAGVGHVVELVGGARVRVSSVVPDAPEPTGVFAPPDDMSLTTVEVEGCAGDVALGMGGESWTGQLDDFATAELFAPASDVVDIVPIANGCVRFTLSFAIPAGRHLASVGFAREGQELTRWELTFGNAPSAPLAGPDSPVSAATGATVGLAEGATVVLRSVDANPIPIDAATTAPEGHQYIVVEGQVCAGSAAVTVRPFSWMVISTGNAVGTNVFAPSTFPTAELEPGQCGAGTVHLLTGADQVPAYVVFTDTLGVELARWAVR